GGQKAARCLVGSRYQTPPSIRAVEGSEFTIECTFNTRNNSTKWFAAWYKTRNYVTEKLSNGTDRIRLSGDTEKRSLSLTVKKADVTDSGTYQCGVGSKYGTSPGTGTQVTIDGKYQHFLLCSTKPFRGAQDTGLVPDSWGRWCWGTWKSQVNTR
uniref:Ig-like domain-containing protein n=1 Tax=Chrysemys picta bellii TaxID=8478 RepID=A0A8C3H9M9_CHRPI